MTENNSEDPCKYCEGKDMREALADALESGKYQEQPVQERHSHAQLRNSQDRYSVTGVAADTLFPFLWIKKEDQWHALDPERIPQEWQIKNLHGEITSLSQDELEEITSQEPGDSTTCPERLACLLGLHTNYEHPQVIEIRCSLLTASEKREAGIYRKQTRDYPLNMLGFQAAAKLLRKEPNLLVGDCTCNPELHEDG